MEHITLNNVEKSKLSNELEIAFNAFQKNILILNKIEKEVEHIIKDFKTFLEKEIFNLTSTLNGEVYHSIRQNLMTMIPSYELDYYYATAKSIIEMGGDLSFTNKYINENEISRWMIEIKKLLDHKFIFTIPSNQKSNLQNLVKEFKQENDEIKNNLIPEPKEIIHKNIDISNIRTKLESKLSDNRIDSIYYNKSKG